MTDHAKRAFLASGDLLSIAQASQAAPYSPEYLSLLARKGKLPALKIARNWLTTSTAVADYVAKQRQRHQTIINKLKVSGKEAA
jgi:hypothetical protein